jgi:hypothetical protein
MRTVQSISAAVLFLFFLAYLFNAPHSVIEPSQSSLGSSRVTTSYCKVTAEGYANLRTGDSYANAVSKLGCSGTEISSSEIAGTRTIMYQWWGVGVGANMNAMFQNDELVTKAQFGL